MALDVNAWLKEIGFTDDKIATLAPVLGERVSEIEKAVLRQSDYSREMNRLQTLQTQLDTNNEKLNADLAEFASMTTDEQKHAKELRDAIEVAEDKAFKLTQKITRYATENGIDPKTVLGDVDPAKPPAAKEPAAFDPGPLREQINQSIGGVASYMLDLQAELPSIAAEHKRLTGEDFDTKKFVAGIKADIAAKKTDNLDPVKRWEAAFGIGEKRVAAATAQREFEIKNAREEGRLAAMSEAALPGGHVPQGHESPVFKTSNVAKGSVLKRDQPSQRLNGAVSALATGKYRSPGRNAA